MKYTSPFLLLAILAAVMPAFAESVDTASPGESVERHLSVDQTFRRWSHDPTLLDVERGDRLETRQVDAEAFETVKLKNVMPPIRFESGVADIPPNYVDKLNRLLDGMRHRRNVRVHFVGHADSQPLSDSLVRVFGDNAGLSRERAGEVAEHFKNILDLAPEAISYEWLGDTDPIASNLNESGRAQNRRVEVELWYDEARDAKRDEEIVVSDDIRRVKVCRMETVCKLRYLEGHARRARVRNLVVPLRFVDESTPIPTEFVRQVSQVLDNLRGKTNVAARFIGYTDDAPLTGRVERIYGDHLSLSKSRALRVALAMQEALALPSARVESDGRGAARPIASNATAHGQALNRRVEVEFWYDDPLQELPEEPGPCPDDSGDEFVTRVYDPPWGRIDTLELENGQPTVPVGLASTLQRALGDVADRDNPRVRFVGYTENAHLDRRTASVYGDDIGLSAARARRAREIVMQHPLLTGANGEHEGRGYVQSDDVVNAGFIQGESSFVRVQVVYDEPQPIDDWDGVDVTPITRELTPKSPYELNVMRITVDGDPIDDPQRSSSDVQRCTDVALDSVDISFRFDNLESRRRLAVAATPSSIAFHGAYAPVVRFRAYDNYSSFIERAEVRILEPGQSPSASPIAIAVVDETGRAEWPVSLEPTAGPVRELRYVLRVYDSRGRYDETEPRPLWLYAGAEAMPNPASDSTAYGESALVRGKIPVEGGTVTVRGGAIPAGHTVWVAGRQVPVDDSGAFIAEEILPPGAHTVEVAVLDADGNGSLYLRDLEFGGRDLFMVGMADLTLSASSSSGPAELLEGNNATQPADSSFDGRLAFYVDGELKNRWRLTASADTREGPVDELFSNFLDKSPDALFRRLDPEDHYPTFGDDSVVEETAPTQGKLYVKMSRGENYGVWGNFEVDYLGNELAHVDRGLYGANGHYESDTTTSFGEKTLAVDAFAAEPGTIGSHERFRGTGGSLYWLRHQDILVGSERLRIELRDKASGLVNGVVDLRPGTDYDIDYLQGRVLLTEPLSSTAEDNLLVRASGLSGDEAHLVARYEYTPGFDELDAVAVGGQAHYWFNDHVRLGATANVNEEDDADSNLGAADLIVRASTDSWLKLQASRSEGLVTRLLDSNDGGFEFAGPADTTFVDADATAYRADVSIGLGEVFENANGRLTLYAQTMDAGYSAPGQAALRDTEQIGGTFGMRISDRLSLAAKADRRTETEGVETRAVEVNLGFDLSDAWKLRGGIRNDLREDASPIPVATQELGERTDAVVQLSYDPQATWRVYGFAQGTLDAEGGREDNNRVGVGGTYRLSDRLKIDGELSGGDLGPGIRVGTGLLYTEATRLYLNYSLENERTDNGRRARRGTLVSGVKNRLSDSSSVYVEQRYRNGGTLTGLTHAAGIRYGATERWTLGANAEVGSLFDARTAAETERHAAGIRVGYGLENVQFASTVEYRNDEAQRPDATLTERSVWLFRNNVKYQVSDDWRLLGKLDHSTSDSSEGSFFDGGYTEFVFGWAYRPVANDRLSALAKYTYFYNVPTSDQVTFSSTSVEYIQKSHIAALDVTYDLTARWSLGGKVAYRLGQVSLDRVNREFFDNSAQLIVLRADFAFLEKWETLFELRSLSLPDIDQQRSGALGAIYRSFGKHFKVGAGYNFTDFSDDLTDLDYDHNGAFINLIGTM
ncbi:MAG: OmpA family protein [Acidobacteriota bacterium]|nr:OmpA family protein [Acidobacteriota bacterium]MDH3783689.1 OmpA family protein [Acidobacteriota bacterium]